MSNIHNDDIGKVLYNLKVDHGPKDMDQRMLSDSED